MSRKIPKKYVPPSLSKADAFKQRQSILKGTMRPKVDYPNRRSKWAAEFERKHGTPITDDKYITRNLMSKKGVEEVLDKGRGAYFSSGSRPNQTPESWARARLASVLLGGPARKVDMRIWNQHKK